MKKKLTEIYESLFHLHEAKDKNFLGRIIFPWSRADVLNLNNRIYPKEVLSTAVENLDKEIKKANVAGTIEHPGGIHSRLDKVSHVLEKVWMKSGRALAQIRILNTTAGRDTMTLIKSGVKVGASSRGIGEVGYGRKIQPGLVIKSIDLVSAPSFGKDAQITQANIIESYVPSELDEAFFSLRDSLSNSIKKEFGKDFWVVDFSNKEVVFRKEGATEDEYQKVSYKIKGKETEITGTAETVKKAVQYEEDKMKEDERLLRGRYYLAIMESKYKGTFEDFKNGRQTKTKILNEEMSEDSIKRKHQEAADSGYSGSLQDYKKLLAESKDIPQTSNEERLYNEAVFAGFKGSLEEWREAVEAGKQKTLLEKAAYPPELEETADYSFKELSEIPKKVLLERYHKDLADGEFEGSFWEWQQMKEKEEKEHLKKELKALDELSS